MSNALFDWDPNDPVLGERAPHELAAILRWHRANVSSQRLIKLLRLRGTQLLKTLADAERQEQIARSLSIPVHAPLFEKESSD